MLETSARLLRLLGLLQARRDWTGPELAERLGVTTRTIRKDVDRLRRLGYPVDAAPGAAGGYRLGTGASLPPLLLDDEEAVAVAVGLRMAAGGGVSGIEETSLRAMGKLEQLLPSRLRRRVGALHGSTVSIGPEGPGVDAGVLTAIAAAVRDRERLRFRYEPDGDGLRTVDPHRLVHARGGWHLVAWDAGSGGWRIFRADGIRLSSHTGPRFAAREDPDGDLTLFVERELGRAVWDYRARVKVHAPAEQIAARVPPAVVVEAIDERSCFANVGSDAPHTLALWIGLMDAEFEVGDQPELAAEVRGLAERYARAAAERPSVTSTPRGSSQS